MLRHHKDGQRRFSDGGRRGSSLDVGGGYENVQKCSVKIRFSRKEADRLACRTSRATRRQNDEGKKSSLRTGATGEMADSHQLRAGRSSERYWSLGVFFCQLRIVALHLWFCHRESHSIDRCDRVSLVNGSQLGAGGGRTRRRHTSGNLEAANGFCPRHGTPAPSPFPQLNADEQASPSGPASSQPGPAY